MIEVKKIVIAKQTKDDMKTNKTASCTRSLKSYLTGTLICLWTIWVAD